MKSKLRNIGGSILPSSDPSILLPLKFKGGCLFVKPDNKKDTHHLVFEKWGDCSILASHPNGYSCRSLSERIISGEIKAIREQLKYIIDCGGAALSSEDIENILQRSKLVQIFWYDGLDVESANVPVSELPKLAGEITFWRVRIDHKGRTEPKTEEVTP